MAHDAEYSVRKEVAFAIANASERKEMVLWLKDGGLFRFAWLHAARHHTWLTWMNLLVSFFVCALQVHLFYLDLRLTRAACQPWWS